MELAIVIIPLICAIIPAVIAIISFAKDRKAKEETKTAIEPVERIINNNIINLPNDLSNFAAALPALPEYFDIPSNIPETEIEIVGRDEIISDIHKAFNEHKIISLYGEGGMGKSMTAAHYAKEHKSDYAALIYAVFTENVKNTIASIGEKWNIAGYDKLNIDERFNYVKTLLSKQTGRILIILDINDESVEHLTDTENLELGDNVKILITSRVRELLSAYEIELKPLSDEFIKTVFINNTLEANREKVLEDLNANSDKFAAIVNNIYLKNTMLIALTAGVMTAENLTLSQIYDTLNKDPLASEIKTDVPIAKDSRTIKSDTLKGHIKSLYSVANLSSDEIDCLRNMSFMDYGGVPLKKFKEWCALDNNTVINKLINKCFISKKSNDENKIIIYMHPAISDAVFEQTGANSENCDDMLDRLYELEIDPDYIYKKQYLFSIVNFILKRLSSEESEALILFNSLLAKLFLTFGYYDISLKLYEQLLETIKYRFKKDNENAAFTYDNLGVVLSIKGQYNLSLKYHKRALKIFSKTFGKNNIHSEKSYINVGNLYGLIGNQTKALYCYLKALNIYKKLSLTDLSTLALIYMNIGIIYKNRLKYDLALSYFNKALVINTKKYGYEHPRTVIVYLNISLLNLEKDNYEAALKFAKKAMGANEKNFEANHPDNIKIYNILSYTYEKIGDTENAEKYREKAENQKLPTKL
jgi:tetratricopeptide (TPR) repeat protein